MNIIRIVIIIIIAIDTVKARAIDTLNATLRVDDLHLALDLLRPLRGPLRSRQIVNIQLEDLIVDRIVDQDHETTIDIVSQRTTTNQENEAITSHLKQRMKKKSQLQLKKQNRLDQTIQIQPEI